MFATLLGGLPRPPLDLHAPIDALVDAACGSRRLPASSR